VFGFRTQYGGGKSTGFALVYDSAEALKKFEPHYRLVRVGAANKIEKPSRQQRTSIYPCIYSRSTFANSFHRQATEEPLQEVPWCRQGQGPQEEQGLSASLISTTNQHGPIKAACDGKRLSRWCLWLWSFPPGFGMKTGAVRCVGGEWFTSSLFRRTSD
jgi:hypothetical protein